jgi:hypothetical protein
MRTTAEQRRQAEQRIRAAADALLRGDIPPDGKCDVTTLARQAGVSRAALYRTYPHLKEEFEKRLAALRAYGDAPDPRDAQIARLRAVGDELRRKLADRDAVIRGLEQFRELALSRLAAQHDEIARLRRQATAAMGGNVRSITPRIPGGTAPRQPGGTRRSPS